MKTTEENMEDSMAVISAIMQMGYTAKTEEEADQIRQVRESIYADYEPEDLKRMVRNVSRFFLSAWIVQCQMTQQDPMKAWSEMIASWNKHKMENE